MIIEIFMKLVTRYTCQGLQHAQRTIAEGEIPVHLGSANHSVIRDEIQPDLLAVYVVHPINQRKD